jgi:predicted NAD/FAD-binding protein
MQMRTGLHVEQVIRHKNETKKVTVIAVDRTTGEHIQGQFDELVFACNAEEVLKSLGAGASWLERRLLPNVRYYNDLIVTHDDVDYMQTHYEFHPSEDMYFVRCDESNPRIIEMSFNLTAYQPHLAGRRTIFQTIFLDDSLRHHWTDGAIDPSRVLKRRSTRQFAHTWTHFAFWVPFVRFLQGKRRTWFAGSYTLFNTHEIAVMSGLAVAERLGAPYPFSHDALATQQFDTYLRLAHGFFVRRKRERTVMESGKK